MSAASPSVCGANFRSTSPTLSCACANRGICGCVSDKAPQWEGEIGLDAWLADEHPATCTPEGTAWLCHNLDFATSGIIVAAKSSAAAGEVSRCFREREADKLYAALVFGHPQWDERKIKAPIAVSQRRFKQRVAASGKSAETHAFVGARGTLRIQPHIGRDASLLWLAPKTGGATSSAST